MAAGTRAGRFAWLLTKDPYAGLDLASARRVGGLVWLLSTLLAAAFVALSEPDMEGGLIGWAAVAVLLSASAAGGYGLTTGRWAPLPDTLLSLSYVNVGLIALLQFLAGPLHSPVGELFVLWVIFTAAVHPPRRVVVFYLVSAVLASAPLAYERFTGEVARTTSARLLLWAAMSLLAVVLLRRVRGQRLALRDEAKRAHEQARTDQLTGLGNRRAFELALEVELSRAQRTRSNLSIALFDLNDLKSINDDHGHLEGDRVLYEVAEQLRTGLRLPDLSFRWGGDEFAVLLPDTDRAAAEKASRRLQERIHKSCRRPDGTPVEVGYGCAESGANTTAAGLLARADEGLRIPKRAASAAKALSD